MPLRPVTPEYAFKFPYVAYESEQHSVSFMTTSLLKPVNTVIRVETCLINNTVNDIERLEFYLRKYDAPDLGSAVATVDIDPLENLVIDLKINLSFGDELLAKTLVNGSILTVTTSYARLFNYKYEG